MEWGLCALKPAVLSSQSESYDFLACEMDLYGMVLVFVSSLF